MERVARVVVDSPLPHLDRPFDYLIPERLAGQVAVGSRVRVVFAGRLISAVVVELAHEAAAGVRLLEIKSAAKIPTFSPAALTLAQAVARRYAGGLWDVLRLMAPARVAALESRAWQVPDAANMSRTAAVWRERAAEWERDLPALPTPERRVWAAPPTPARHQLPTHALLAQAAAWLGGGEPREGQPADEPGSVIVLVPDARALAALEATLADAGVPRWTHRGGEDPDHPAYAVLDNEAGPTARYATYLGAMHGEVRLILGTRAAVLQPVPHLAGVVMWDDGSDTYAEPHAPYPHARTVAAMRAQDEGAGLLVAAYAPTVDAAALVAHGFAQAEVPSRAQMREAAPAVEVHDETRRAADGGAGRHWMPPRVWRPLVQAAATAPCAIVVPRAGYVTAVACATCGAWAECPMCGSEVQVPRRDAPPRCRDGGHELLHWHCPECHSPQLRAVRQGVGAIVDQVRRMAPGLTVVESSAAAGVLTDAPTAGLVVATPGALPPAVGGYARLAVLGADAVGLAGLGAEFVPLRWWLNAGALVRARAAGGVVDVVGEPLPLVRRALSTWDGWGAATEAYEERARLALPPWRRAVQVEGDAEALAVAGRVTVGGISLVEHAGVDVAPRAGSLVVMMRRADAQDVVDALRELVVARSKAGLSPLRVRVDPSL